MLALRENHLFIAGWAILTIFRLQPSLEMFCSLLLGFRFSDEFSSHVYGFSCVHDWNFRRHDDEKQKYVILIQ